MLQPRLASFLPILAAAACLPASAQSVVSAHSGLVYFFEGSVFVGDQPLEQRFGRFPDIGEGLELRTERGRAEVLLTPGVFLRIGENGAIRMVSNKLADTRVELLYGSAILESKEAVADASVTLIHKSWQVRFPRQGAYRIDSDPPQVSVYRGDAEVSGEADRAAVTVTVGQILPLAPVLITEAAPNTAHDPFGNWATNRSQAIASDNATAAGIVDDPNLVAGSDAGLGGVSYFPATGIPSLGITTPYGLSLWNPYQSAFGSPYFSPYPYGLLYLGRPGGYPRSYPVMPVIRPPASVGPRPGGVAPARPIFTPRPSTPSRVAAPHMGVHAGGHR